MLDKIVDMLRKEYPEGTRIELLKMDDTQAPPIGTKGTIVGVDDIGSILVRWDNGSSLNLIYGEDLFNVIVQEKVWYIDISKIVEKYFSNDLILIAFRVIYIHDKRKYTYYLRRIKHERKN